MSVVHNETHTPEQFSKVSLLVLGLGLGLVFVCLFKFSILCAFVFQLILFLCCLLLSCEV